VLSEPAIVDVLTPLSERERWPRLRTGERDRISGKVRRLVYERDGRRCVYCGSTYDLQLDHVIPWSAMGSDRSDNLRTLCELCNGERSNRRDPIPARIVPVVDWCDWCAQRRPSEDGRQIKAYCGQCGLTSWVSNERYLL
jgi:ribosomal protein S27AE